MTGTPDPDDTVLSPTYSATPDEHTTPYHTRTSSRAGYPDPDPDPAATVLTSIFGYPATPSHTQTSLAPATPLEPEPKPDDTVLIPKSGNPDKPTTHSHVRTGESRTRIWLWAILPLILHFVSILTLTAFLTTYVDRNDFNIDSRKVFSKFTPLQSDITTAISSGIAIYRVFAAGWSTAMVWRSIFLLMGEGGITIEQINSLLTWQIHLHPRYKPSRFGFLVSIILLSAVPSQFSGPILTGSITWSSSYHLTKGERVTRITSASSGDQDNLAFWFSQTNLPVVPLGISFVPGLASIAWLGSLEQKRTMKRVIRFIHHLPINSTLNNVTLPYFAISKLEWISDPMKVIPQIVNLSMDLDWNSFKLPGGFALTPDSWGGVSESPSPSPGVLSETRIIVGVYATDSDSCASEEFGDLPANIGFNLAQDICLIYGRVTYVAGEAECRACRVSSWSTVQNDTALTVSPSKEAPYAIKIMWSVAATLALQNSSLPRTYNNLDEYITESLIRSYGASWTFLNALYHGSYQHLSSDVQIAIPTSRANILWWRVWTWFFLNLLFTLSGIFFLFLYRMSGQQMVGNPSLAALLLDTSDVLHKRDRALCNFSTLTKEDGSVGWLHFTQDWENGGHRRVEVIKE